MPTLALIGTGVPPEVAWRVIARDPDLDLDLDGPPDDPGPQDTTPHPEGPPAPDSPQESDD